MIFVLTPREMQSADRGAAAGEIELMRRAGQAIADAVEAENGTFSLVAFAGPGNNGGDAFAACAELKSLHPHIDAVIYAADAPHASAARSDAEERARTAGVAIRPFPSSLEACREALRNAACVLDALFGTGSRLPLAASYGAAVQAINESGARVVSVDIPSGSDAQFGAVSAETVRAAATVTLGALKPGLLLEPARSYVGRLYLGDLGIADADLAAHAAEFAALDDDEFRSLLPHREANADKRSAGAPLIIAGSQQFPGAAVLCAWGAARAGAGYVTVATPQAAAATLRAHLIEQVVTEIPDAASVADAVDQLLETSKHAGAVGIGPGLGLDARTGEIVRGFLQRCALPFVADASALFHFAKHLDVIDTPRAVVTPHAGEFARLSGGGTLGEGERVERLRAFFGRAKCTTLLKGRTTLIYAGNRIHLNTSGTSALATAGTGDVLTGIIATLLAQGLSPENAARVGAYWHGLAGAYCARLRPVGVTAADLPDALAAAIPPRRRYARTRPIFES